MRFGKVRSVASLTIDTIRGIFRHNFLPETSATYRFPNCPPESVQDDREIHAEIRSVGADVRRARS